jgi:hypothetical protein
MNAHQPITMPISIIKARARAKPRASVTLQRLGGWVGGSIGQSEALAGINVQSQTERAALWHNFSHLFAGDSQVLIDTVMDHCAAITLRRIKRGELSLIPNRYQRP